MFMEVIGTFEWSSFRMMRSIPKRDAFIIVLVSGVTAPAALTAFLTAIGGAVAVGKVAGSTAKLGNTLVENALPKHHDKWKGKF